MTRKVGGKRSAMKRAADAQKIVKVILRSLDFEPVSVSRLSEEFGVDRHSIRDDISIWIEAYGHEDPTQTEALLNWRDSHVAPKKIRDGYIDLALHLMDERMFDLKSCAEVLGVDPQSLSYWMRRAGVAPEPKRRTREENRHSHAMGDLDLTEKLEQMRLEMITRAREDFRDQITAAEAL